MQFFVFASDAISTTEAAPVVDRSVLGVAWANKCFHPEDFVVSGDGICRLHPQHARVKVGRVDEVLGSGKGLVISRCNARGVWRRGLRIMGNVDGRGFPMSGRGRTTR
jgi:hypothetical protein